MNRPCGHFDRFDKLLCVGTDGDAASRLGVLEALTRKFALAEGCGLRGIAERCDAAFTGAGV